MERVLTSCNNLGGQRIRKPDFAEIVYNSHDLVGFTKNHLPKVTVEFKP